MCKPRRGEVGEPRKQNTDVSLKVMKHGKAAESGNTTAVVPDAAFARLVGVTLRLTLAFSSSTAVVMRVYT